MFYFLLTFLFILPFVNRLCARGGGEESSGGSGGRGKAMAVGEAAAEEAAAE